MAPPIYFLFKKYSVEVKKWLSSIFHIPRLDATGAKVKVIYATPERAIAKYVVQLRNGTIDIPIISFYLAGISFQPEKNTIGENLETIIDKDNNTAFRLRPMQVYQLNYTINIWTKLQIDMDLILYQLVSQFHPMRWLAVDSEIDYKNYDWLTKMENGPSQGKIKNKDGEFIKRPGQWFPLAIDSINDASDLEPGEGGNRAIRTDVSLVCDRAYLPMGGYERKVIKGIKINTIADFYTEEGISIYALSESDFEYLMSDDEYWLPGVNSYSDLPLTGNKRGDIRRVFSETTYDPKGEPYIWGVDDLSFYKAPVSTFNDLPLTGNYHNDIRFVTSENKYYIWNNSNKEWLEYNRWIAYRNYLRDLVI